MYDSKIRPCQELNIIAIMFFMCMCFIMNRRPISSSVFGADALITKPAVSIAPMIVVNILNRYGYQTIKQKSTAPPSEDLSQLHSVMFSLLCLVPVVLGCVQCIVWSWYPYKTTGQTNERTATWTPSVISTEGLAKRWNNVAHIMGWSWGLL